MIAPARGGKLRPQDGTASAGCEKNPIRSRRQGEQMKQIEWRAFPYGDRVYRYTGSSLEAHWPSLHGGDREVFPDARRVADQLERCGPALSHDADPNTLADLLQSAWRDYHAGDFCAAMTTGHAVGPIGAVVAGRAAIAYAMHLENDPERVQSLLCDTASHCERLSQIEPGWANAWYTHALALARYSQQISIVKALGRGLGSKVRQSLMVAIALEPDHAAAHAALGGYHIEVSDKVGRVVARLAHGASRAEGLRHFERAIVLDPDSPSIRMAYANALAVNRRSRRSVAVERNVTAAAACQPRDAIAHLDAERARALLEGVGV
ncbi:MAG: hypothetical protein R3E34_01315 [Rhodocyclaceae bacterium]